MKQKITVKVQMNCEKCRKKAFKIAAEAGADSLAFQGEDKDLVVITGDGIDSVRLTRRLRKKVGRADIIKLEELKPADKEKPTSDDTSAVVPVSYVYYQNPPFTTYEVIHYYYY